MSAIEEQAKDASINRLKMHSVGLLNRIPTVGYDPIAKRLGDSEEPGTGCAGRWGDHHFILTAKHVVERAQPRDLGIFCHPSGGINYRLPGELRKKETLNLVSLHDQDAVIHRCAWEDLAVIATSPNALMNLEFFDAVNEWIDPPMGDALLCFGFPSDYGQMVETKMVGNNEERTIALPSRVFITSVLPPPTDEELKYTITDFDPDKHYSVPYDDASKGRHPRGISGAAMWWESDQKQIIWRPNFKFAGVCTACYKRGTVVQVVKASVVRRFLAEVFGPAAQQR